MAVFVLIIFVHNNTSEDIMGAVWKKYASKKDIFDLGCAVSK